MLKRSSSHNRSKSSHSRPPANPCLQGTSSECGDAAAQAVHEGLVKPSLITSDDVISDYVTLLCRRAEGDRQELMAHGILSAVSAVSSTTTIQSAAPPKTGAASPPIYHPSHSLFRDPLPPHKLHQHPCTQSPLRPSKPAIAERLAQLAAQHALLACTAGFFHAWLLSCPVRLSVCRIP